MNSRIANNAGLFPTIVIVDRESFAEITGNWHINEHDLCTAGVETCHELHEEIELLVRQTRVSELLGSQSSIIRCLIRWIYQRDHVIRLICRRGLWWAAKNYRFSFGNNRIL